MHRDVVLHFSELLNNLEDRLLKDMIVNAFQKDPNNRMAVQDIISLTGSEITNNGFLLNSKLSSVGVQFNRKMSCIDKNYNKSFIYGVCKSFDNSPEKIIKNKNNNALYEYDGNK